MAESQDRSGIRAKSEEALGDLAQALLDNPVFSQALSRALGAGERAAQAQRTAMSAVGVSASSDLERLERRLRLLSSRLEEIEDRMDDLGSEVLALRRQVSDAPSVATDQDSLKVPEPGASAEL